MPKNEQKEKQQMKRGVPRSEWPVVQVKVRYDADGSLEQWPIVKLPLGDRAKNALGRVGIKTVGDVMDHWDHLMTMPALGYSVDGKKPSSGLGETVAREIRAVVFALLCSEAQVDIAVDLGRA